MARKKKPEEHINHERWLVSYADFITLLFAFFTSLYAISTVDAKKAGKMVFSTRSAFSLGFFASKTPTLGGSSELGMVPSASVDQVLNQADPAGGHGRSDARDRVNRRKRSQPLREVADRIKKMVREKQLDKQVTVRLGKTALIVSLNQAAFFQAGAADVRMDALPVLDAIADDLLANNYELRAEGHTDDIPTPRGQFRSNWDLSSARAVSIVDYLVQEFAYPPELLSAAGFASFRPAASNDTPEGRAKNRRVDLVILAKSMRRDGINVPLPESEDEPESEDDAAGSRDEQDR